MVKKSNVLVLVALAGATLATAQKKATKPVKGKTTVESVSADDQVKKRFAEQHAKWKKGDEILPGKPKSLLEIGLNGGYFFYSGDVSSAPGWMVGIHARKAISYLTSFRLGYNYGTAYGVDYKPSLGITSDVTAGIYGNNNVYYYKYKSTYHQASFDVLFNLGNINFHKKKISISPYLGVGVGVDAYETYLDAKNAAGVKYDPASILAVTGSNPSYSDRAKVRDAISALYDGTYETRAQVESKFNVTLSDMYLNPVGNLYAGIEFRLGKRVSLGIEAKGTLSIMDDLYDGRVYEENYNNEKNFTPEMDIPIYFNVRLNYHVGSLKKAIEPLWFVNPLATPMTDLADNKKKVKDLEGMLADTDQDGVPDRLDKEPNTPADCPVDVRGRQLDSDEDGVPDCQDKEKFSAPGYPVDANGVAQAPKYATQDDLNRVVRPLEDKLKTLNQTPTASGDAMGNWWLPMIHFDLDHYGIKPQFYEELHQVASVMQMYPNVKIAVEGHTDVRNTDQYNVVLSWNRSNQAIEYLMKSYGLPRERFVIRHDGEALNLVKNASSESAHYMNRRVEFHIANAGDTDMPRPEGKAGKL